MCAAGLYEEATRLFVQAIKEQHGGGDSRLGGDIQLWLGLAYQARLPPPPRMHLGMQPPARRAEPAGPRCQIVRAQGGSAGPQL